MSQINFRIGSGEDVLRNKQLKTALNQLVKNNLIDDSNIDEIFGDPNKLNEMIDAYKDLIIKAGKKELRTPLTHARNLASFYVAFFTFDAEGMNFQEAFKAAIHRKYDNVYKGFYDPKDKKNLAKIKSKFITYNQIATEIIKEGYKKSPDIWATHDARGGGVSVIVRYIRGGALPSVRVPIEKVEHFEDFLAVPRGTFTNKLTLLPRGLYKKEPRNKRKNHGKHKSALVINPALQKYIDEYSDYRIFGKKPEVKYVPPEFIGKEKYLSVSENYKSKWTIRTSTNECSSKNIFIDHIRAFSNFCIIDLEMEPESITLEHLTTIDILEKWKDKAIANGRGGHACKNLFQVIKKSVGYRGYLRLCGTPGNRTIEDFNAELNILPTLIDEWGSFLDGGIEKKDSKRNIRFLLEMTINEMWDCVDNAIQAAFDHAGKLIIHPSHNHVEIAYHRTQALTVLYLSRVSPIRLGNWTDLRFNKDNKDFSYDEPSLTWYGNKKCYRLYVPISFLKNQSRPGIKPVDVYYPVSFNNIIKKHLFYRQKYIDVIINKNGIFSHKPKRFCVKLDEVPEKTDPDNKFEDDSTFGARFKRGTREAFKDSLPDVKQEGINHHATRHLAATWFLNQHPSDYVGLATLLNDNLMTVTKEYAEIDAKLAQERINQAVVKKNRLFEFN